MSWLSMLRQRAADKETDRKSFDRFADFSDSELRQELARRQQAQLGARVTEELLRQRRNQPPNEDK